MIVGTRHEALFTEDDLVLLTRVLTEWISEGFSSQDHPDVRRAAILLTMLRVHTRIPSTSISSSH